MMFLQARDLQAQHKWHPCRGKARSAYPVPRYWTKVFTLIGDKDRRWQQCHTAGEVVEVEEVEAEDVADEVVNLGVKEEEVPQQAVPQQAETIQVPTLTMVLGVKINHTHATKHPDTLTYLQYSHVSVTGPMGSQLISVWSQRHVHGRTFGSRNPTNEILTASAKTNFISQNLFMT